MDTIIKYNNIGSQDNIHIQIFNIQRKFKSLSYIPYKILFNYESIFLWQQILFPVFNIINILLLKNKYYFNITWNSGLKHYTGKSKHTILVVDNVNDKEKIFKVCTNLKNIFLSLNETSIVLITNYADFHFYSRLGWMIEYLPSALPNSSLYIAQKKQYLAWRYKNSTVLPLSLGFLPDKQVKFLLQEYISI